MPRSSLVGRCAVVAVLAVLGGAACSQNGAQQTSPAGSVATLGPAATQGSTATPTSAGLAAPAAPANLTANDVSLTNSAPCTAEDSESDGCLSLNWTPPAGQVDGYRVYIGEVGGAYIDGPGPSGWYVCPENGSLAIPVATIPGGKASYYVPYLGEHGPSCVALSAYNAAGESPWDIVMVGSDDEVASLSATWTTYKGDGFSVDFPGDTSGSVSLAASVADGYEYMETNASRTIGSETNPQLVFAVDHITFVGKTPPNSGPDLVAFFEKTLAYYEPYSIGDPTVSNIASITVAGHAGFSFTLTKGGSIEKGEIFLFGSQAFGVVAGGAAGSANLASVAKFLESFRIG
ncbi:MAG: hypothetical protein ABSC46_05565 [Candidatus Limnocylindrales bacterium]